MCHVLNTFPGLCMFAEPQPIKPRMDPQGSLHCAARLEQGHCVFPRLQTPPPAWSLRRGQTRGPVCEAFHRGGGCLRTK